MAGFDDIIRSVMTTLGMSPPQRDGVVPDVTYGTPLKQYPDQADVANARQSDFDYGSGNEAYNSGRVANTLRPNVSAVDDLAQPKSGRLTPGTPTTAQAYSAAQLAINRSPISALGYDPHKINLDTEHGPGMAIAGMYDPDTDVAYSNQAYPGNLVHESTHRGLEMLNKAGVIPPELRAKLPRDEEYLVRYIMARHMGDAEKDRGGSGSYQRAEALGKFGKDVNDPLRYTRSLYGAENRQALEDLNKIAAQYLYKLHPGGPR